MFAAIDTAQLVTWSAVGVLLLVAAVAGIFFLAGLFGARSLVRREIGAYFVSPIAYVVLVVFLLVTGYLFYLTLRLLTDTGPRGAEFPVQGMFGSVYFWLVFVLIPPVLTMRLFAEERGSGTLEMLLTAPLRDWQVVLSKYAACLGFYLLLWVPTLAYLPILLDLHQPVVHTGAGTPEGLIDFAARLGIVLVPSSAWTPWSIALVAGLGAVVLACLSALPRFGTTVRIVGLVLFLAGIAAAAVGFYGHYSYDPEHLIDIPAGVDPMPVVCSYVGLALVGAMFLALGMFISSLVRSQLVAALVSWVLCLALVATGFLLTQVGSSSPTHPLFAQVADFFSVPLHFSRDFSRGLIDTRHLVLYGSTAVFCLFLTVRSLESRRWR
jgi:ABC-type transport system involved in multi-copper enzyme maturation permease subunit